MPASTATGQGRARFIDGLRGLSVVFMVFNHATRWWMDGTMGWGRYHLVYFTLALGVPTWLFLVGFCASASFTKTALSRPAGLRRHALRHARRGFAIILAGYALNVLVFPEDPWYGTGALHSIGLAVIAALPLSWLTQAHMGRILVLTVPPLSYGSFVWLFAPVELWASQHPTSPAIFFDFAPWPWMAAVFLGLVPGWLWAQGSFKHPHAVALVASGGFALLASFATLQWASHGTFWVDFRDDFLLNRHWIPKPVTTLLMYGTTALVFALLYWLMEIRRFRLDWLVVLGRTTLALYFVHHLIGLVLMKRWLGVAFDNWFAFVAATLGFILVLVGLGRAWLSAKAHWFGRGVPPAPPAKGSFANSLLKRSFNSLPSL